MQTKIDYKKLDKDAISIFKKYKNNLCINNNAQIYEFNLNNKLIIALINYRKKEKSKVALYYNMYNNYGYALFNNKIYNMILTENYIAKNVDAFKDYIYFILNDMENECKFFLLLDKYEIEFNIPIVKKLCKMHDILYPTNSKILNLRYYYGYTCFHLIKKEKCIEVVINIGCIELTTTNITEHAKIKIDDANNTGKILMHNMIYNIFII